ncbi:GNAT family N-acetyltransferase [uncultured Photobacterium sp.]|uniref:GNAT family N-acetyltransferase n=1 Tax=uncultured Photobacterium sp. TaxID=173973 RepID=UPI00260A9B54|nr:GNAT family N-acetyltransferase [uncultured Photobacterium sp.]
MKQEKIETNRLILRAFELSDAERVAILVGDKRVSDMTANIPYPYSLEMAAEWISLHKDVYVQKIALVYAIELKDSGELIGAISFPSWTDDEAVLGYWLGVEYWGKGYMAEAGTALIDFATAQLGIRKITALHFVENEQSRSVIKKLGLSYIENRFDIIGGERREVCCYEGQTERVV